MTLISQFFILSGRGDTIVKRDYLGNIPKSSVDVFYRKVRFWGTEGEVAPPIFHLDGITYFHVKTSGVFLVATTRHNVSPSVVLELLARIGRLIKDYCGVLSEDSIRKNFVLVYEILDEVIDYGVAQSTSTEALRSCVLNEPTAVSASQGAGLFMGGSVGPDGAYTRGATAITKSVLDTSRTGRHVDEIFVDVVERITLTFDAAGFVLNAEVDGAIQVKSYLTGNPPIRVALSEDLTIAGRGQETGVVLDDCLFHEAASLENFDVDRTITLQAPPDGEFALMNYRSTRMDFQPPFRVTCDVSTQAPTRLEVTITLSCDIPKDKSASSFMLKLPLPKTAGRPVCTLDASARALGEKVDFSEKDSVLSWAFRKVPGMTRHVLQVSVPLQQPAHASTRRDVGPASLQFVIPMWTPSQLQVRFLQVLKKAKDYNPYRWVRYVTQAASYVIRTSS